MLESGRFNNSSMLKNKCIGRKYYFNFAFSHRGPYVQDHARGPYVQEHASNQKPNSFFFCKGKIS